MSTPEEIKAEYTSSLADLTFNSKPLINVLTMLADENSPNSKVIVEAIEEHLSKVHIDVKLPLLYLIDCIVKTVGGTYASLFSQNIVSTFCGVFKVVNEKTRAEMYKLRQTWNDVFPQMKLYAIDVQISLLDPAWPITAKPPSNSIHFNPKFLKNNPTSAMKKETEPTPVIPGPVDKETLIMQEKLIQKQKELLELQQKKLELEVLQTQVKLRERVNQTAPGRSQNILLKPEVAKQLVPSLAQHRPVGINAALIQQQQQKNSQVAASNGTKINPVSSALINAKPIRDPRLMRQQKQQQPKPVQPQPDGNADNQLQQRTALLENNKIVTNKVGVRKVRNDPRLVNKDDAPVQKTDTNRSINPSKSRNSEPAPHKSHKSSRASSRSAGSDTGSLRSSSSTNSDASVKAKSDSVKSPVKNKKKEKSDDKRPASPRDKRDRSGNSDSPTNFKGIKHSVKNRNYVRRNIVGSASPDVTVQDEDLRAFGPPEKQPRLLTGDSIDEPSATTTPIPQPVANTDMDVDLRQLPAVIGKKRSSTDSPEQNSAKKTKSEILDKLFGDEDTDLRQLAMNAEPRPKTPPPPIISSGDVIVLSDSPKSNLDAVRAKLANATNRDKVLSKSFNKKRMRMDDQDLRNQIQITPETTNKIIISPEDETNIKSGKMTNEESKKLLAKIILQMEKNKLKEAKRKDSEESFNISLQPISDEEFIDSDNDDVREVIEIDDDPKSRENTPIPKPLNEDSLIPFNDKDERLNTQKGDYAPQGFYPRDNREMRRFPGPNNWRGGRGNRRWDNQPPRIPVRPWKAWNNPPAYAHNQFEDAGVIPEEEPTLTSGFVNVDEIKSIAIDGISRDIRFYGETAVAFIDWDDPRELTFHDGARTVTFNDKESYVMGLNEPYKEITVDGEPHLVRLGAPSREIFIDRVPYECFFGGAGILIELDGVPTKVQLEGPPPQVNIGKNKRTDLVAGKINLFINAKVVVPVFLDAKVQKFVLDNETSTLKFVDALKTVLINDVPFNVEYGGLPKPFIIHGIKHFIRFSVLPKGVKPGRVRIVDMEGEGSASPKLDENSQDGNPSDAYDPAMPIAGLLDKPVGAESPERNSNSPNFYQKLFQQQQNNLDALSNSMTSTLGQPEATGGYQCEKDQHSEDAQPTQAPAPVVAPPLNINDLFQKLVASGFVTSTADQKKPPRVKESPRIKEPPRVDPAPPPKSRRNPCSNLKPVSFHRPESLRMRQHSLYSILYSGMQCSSCGMRFSPEASMLYSQHLDWHFRQNRKGKRNSRVAASRRWYYSLSDWKNYEELEDLEEREKNYFDQQQQAEGTGEEADEETEVPSVVADPDSTQESCIVCHDKFDQFFHEEKEEWHLKNAVRMDEKTYHPVCYEDYLQSLMDQTAEESFIKPTEDKPKDEETIPGLEIVIDDDDDEIPEQPLSTEVVSLGSDESKPAPDVVEKEPEPPVEEDEGDDDDVILNEVAPIKIVVDDDDDETGAEHNDGADTSLEQTEDDGFVEIAGLVSLPNGKHVKIKAEPVDKELDDAPTPIVVEDQAVPEVELSETPTNRSLVASMDGNVDIVASASPNVVTTGIGGNKIKINISKPLPVISKEKELVQDSDLPSETYIDPFEPFPPGEEPEPATLKNGLKSVRLTKLPPVRKGTELTGMCSVM